MASKGYSFTASLSLSLSVLFLSSPSLSLSPLFEFCPQNCNEWHEGPKFYLKVSPPLFISIWTRSCHLGQQGPRSSHCCMPCVMRTSLGSTHLPPLAYKPSPELSFATLYFSSLRLPTLVLLYHKQFTSISFTIFPLKFHFPLRTKSLLPQDQIRGQNTKEKYQIVLSKTLKNGPSCVNSGLSGCTPSSSKSCFGGLLITVSFYPFFYLICIR